jgi:mono/diheme cytochrome c family protein
MSGRDSLRLCVSSRLRTCALPAHWLFAVAVLSGGLHSAANAQEQTKAQIEAVRAAALQASMEAHRKDVVPFFETHCVRCHGAKKQEGELSLEKLDPDMTTASAARWATLLEQITTREMPPEGEPQPTPGEIQKVVDWIRSEMKRSGKHLATRKEYANGNRVPHELLFGPGANAPFDAAPGLRRLSHDIYDAFSKDVGKNVNGLGNPFSPAGGTTFLDMGSPKIDEPVTTQLISNALSIVRNQTAWREDKGQLKWVGQREFQPLFEKDAEVTDEQLQTAVTAQFLRVLRRKPTDEELARFLKLMRTNEKAAGRETGFRFALAAVFLLPEAVFRSEIGAGPKDVSGRVRLSPRETAFAINYALSDRLPPAWLLDAASKGDLDSEEQIAAAVRRMMEDPKQQTPRIMRFFREYFGYAAAEDVFKESKENQDHKSNVLVSDTDQLVQYILAQDKEVLRELLTTTKSFVNNRLDPQGKKMEPGDKKKAIHKSYGLPDDWKWTADQPVELPKDERAGILTQPAWLVAFSTTTDNHAILRGKWVRERLLGGVVPDIPITVDAQLPDEPEKTLRERMRVTQGEYCWKCHQLMNRVGLPFEQYDHYGRFRTEELGQPVDATGGFEHTLDPKLQGDVTNPVEFVRKMADSEIVEQVFVRHCFRYWLGRNETPGDANSLQTAHNAYRESGGSMKALIVSLLTSESFLYRVPLARPEQAGLLTPK